MGKKIAFTLATNAINYREVILTKYMQIYVKKTLEL